MRNISVVLAMSALFLGWNAPSHYPPWTTFHLELFAAVGVCLLHWSQWSPPWRESQDSALQRMPCASIAWLFVALIPLAQYAAGQLPYRGDALIGAMYATGAAMAIYTGRLWAARQGARLARAITYVTILVAALAANGVALTQWLRLDPPGWWAMELIDDRPFASLGQPNQFGLLMVLGMTATTCLYEARILQQRWVTALTLGYLGWGVLISGSRSSVLALALILGVWFVTCERVPTRVKRWEALVAVVLGVITSLTVEPLQRAFLIEGTQLRSLADPGARPLIWLHFLAAIQDRPWLGYGFNQGVAALAAASTHVQPSRNVTFAHNVLLDVTAWAGIPMALALMAALSRWLLGWLRRTRVPEADAARCGVFAIWLALVTQSMLEFPYAHTYFLFPAALLAGVMLGPESPTTGSIRASTPATTVALLATVLLGALAVEYFSIEEGFRSARFTKANFAQASPPTSSTSSSPWLLDHLAALNASALIEIRPGMTQARLQEIHALSRRFHILSTRLDYARALALNGQLEQAEAELEVIRSVYPPSQFAAIEKNWRAWLEAQRLIPHPPSSGSDQRTAADRLIRSGY